MNKLLPTIILSLLSISLFAQDDLENILNSEQQEETDYTTATFKATRIMNGHSIERMQTRQLDFRIHHRFGLINSGIYEYWGLDQANMHFGLEYGITDWIMVGVGRGNYFKTYDGFTKLSILRQSTGKVNMPISVSWVSTVAINTLKWADTSRTNYFSSRMAYSHQVLIARKFNKRFSLQITPTMVHRNIVQSALDPNDLWSCGVGGRIKITSRISLNAEYFYVYTPKNMSEKIYHPLSLGLDIETGGHVFQLIFTNSEGMIERDMIGDTRGRWSKGDIHFGFNISRVFSL
jgi:hypothetical protein